AFDANGLYVHNCGEQPLPPYGCCDLGPIILTRFVRHPFGFGGVPAFDFEAFGQSVATQVRALDNVLDLTFWPLPQQRDEAAAKRRIGVGFTGMGNALALLCLRYDLPEETSKGIEPTFAWRYRRNKRKADGSITEYAVEDHAWRLYRELGGDVEKLPGYFVSAFDIPATSHSAMMEEVQPFVDTAIS